MFWSRLVGAIGREMITFTLGEAFDCRVMKCGVGSVSGGE